MRTGIAVMMLLAACGKGDDKQGKADERMAAMKATEAEINLKAIEKSLKAYVAETGALPTGQVGPTPATPCCEGADHKCPPGGFDDPIWQTLDFDVVEPHRFQYAYRHDGAAVTVDAVGDLDCDGTATTFRLSGGIVDGLPRFELTRPANPD